MDALKDVIDARIGGTNLFSWADMALLIGIQVELQLEEDDLRWLIENANSCIDFRACLLNRLANEIHQEFTTRYPEYASRHINVDAFIAQHGVEKYLAAATLYEAFQSESWPGFPDLETLQFYMEIFETVLLPVGITFVPWGIGDLADIIQSCGDGISWDCVLAILGILIPFDELMDLWKHWDEVVVAWKTTKAYGVMQAGWKLLVNCPKEIRTDPEILAKVKAAIDRGVKSLDDMVNHANVPTIIFRNSAVEHIFRGSNGGGVHHISALVDNPGYKIFGRTDTGLGCYKARVQKPDGTFFEPDKDFFPDDWDEFKVIDEIRHAYGNKNKLPGNNNHWEGTASNGKKILMYIDSNDKIITAFPQ
ncbi:MAG: EndoU domain-containing protein [Saprospiraceae bacterium]|nr:EndoU domain-containing protein [Saprospiraceae bacterium]